MRWWGGYWLKAECGRLAGKSIALSQASSINSAPSSTRGKAGPGVPCHVCCAASLFSRASITCSRTEHLAPQRAGNRLIRPFPRPLQGAQRGGATAAGRTTRPSLCSQVVVLPLDPKPVGVSARSRLLPALGRGGIDPSGAQPDEIPKLASERRARPRINERGASREIEVNARAGASRARARRAGPVALLGHLTLAASRGPGRGASTGRP